jgi:hypothetical protein
MASLVWQRAHGPDIVTEVAADHNGFWVARAFLRSDPTCVVRTPKPLNSIHSACAKADALARMTFIHVCDVPACGNWGPLLSEMAGGHTRQSGRAVKLKQV